MEDIKDYLHLYLQSEATFSKEFIDDGGSWTVPVKITPHRYRMAMDDASVSCIKLYLRPLSDMTEEEGNQFLHNHEFVSYAWTNCVSTSRHCVRYDFTYHSSNRVRQGSLRFDELEPKDFTWLLSKGFDLFGLIEAGLAIDKTKV